MSPSYFSVTSRPIASSKISLMTFGLISFLLSLSMSIISSASSCLLKCSVMKVRYSSNEHLYFFPHAMLMKRSTGLQFQFEPRLLLFMLVDDYFSFLKSNSESNKVNSDQNQLSYCADKYGAFFNTGGNEYKLAYFFFILELKWNCQELITSQQFVLHTIQFVSLLIINLVSAIYVKQLWYNNCNNKKNIQFNRFLFYNLQGKQNLIYYPDNFRKDSFGEKYIQKRVIMVKLKKIYNDSYKNQIIDRQVKKKLMNLNFKQVLSTYLKQNNRISISLSILLHLLIECRNPVTEFSKVIKRSSQPLKLFRALILLHECYLNSILQSQQALQILCEIKMVMNTKINSKLDQIISKQVLGPYILYLQKCFHVQTEEVYESQMNPEQILYQYLNLIKLGLSMVDILYTFGRYFKQVYSFIIDFNVLVGKDFAQIYESKIKSTLKKNKKLWDEQMKLELQKVHEKMYVVYYNCYYYKYLKFYIPKWIDTDYNRQRNHSVPVKRQRSQFKSPLKQNKSNIFTNLKVKPTQMSISTIFTQTKVSPGQFSNKMANSTIIPKDRKTKNLSLSFCPYVISQFTCEVSQNNNEEYVIDQIQSQNQNQKQNIQKNDKTQDPYILLASMERVIQLIDQNIEQASKCNNNKK